MKYLIYLLIIGIPLAAAQETPHNLPSKTAEAAGLDPKKLAEIDEAIQQRIAEKKVSGVVLMISHKGCIVTHKAYGIADQESAIPMQPDTLFRIYSMTKAITSVAAMMCWEEGKFKLDDPVAKYIPSFKNIKGPDGKTSARPMTVRDLFLHTSGLTYGWGNNSIAKAVRRANLFDHSTNLETMIAKLSKLPLQHHPGTEWHYSVSIDVLGHLVAIWSETPFDQFLHERLFAPLDMKDTDFHIKPDDVKRFATTYTKGLKVSDKAKNSRYLKPTKLASGGGGLVSTARDYMHFLVMLERGGQLFGNRILKEETVSLMTRNHLPDDLMPIRFGDQMRWGVGHGLGFNVRTTTDERWDPPGRPGEYGWGGMASTHYWVSPRDELCVITLEQFVPYNFVTEWAIKNLIYDALPD